MNPRPSFQHIMLNLRHVQQITPLYKAECTDETLWIPHCRHKGAQDSGEEACTAVLREAAGLNENIAARWGPLDLIWIPSSNTIRIRALSWGTKTSHSVQDNQIRKKVFVFSIQYLPWGSLQTLNSQFIKIMLEKSLCDDSHQREAQFLASSPLNFRLGQQPQPAPLSGKISGFPMH